MTSLLPSFYFGKNRSGIFEDVKFKIGEVLSGSFLVLRLKEFGRIFFVWL